MTRAKDMLVGERRRFAKSVIELMTALGAERLPDDWCLAWQISTPIGVLRLSVHKEPSRGDDYDPSVFGRFEDVAAAKAAGRQVDGLSVDLCGGNLNPYSGKWNHHYWGAWTAADALVHFERNLRRVLAIELRRKR